MKAQPPNKNPFAPATGVELEENSRALTRRAVIVWVGVAILVLVFCVGVYFGLFVGMRIGV